MWRKLSDFLHRVSNGWVALGSLIFFLLFTALVLPGQASRAEMETGNSQSPDLQFFYTADELYQMADSYGENGRQAYVRARFTFDLVWPIVYMVFMVTGISWTFRKAFAPDSIWQRANILPVWGGLFDYLENISTSLVMVRYPSPTAVLDVLAPVFTMVKWSLVGASSALLLIGALIAAARLISARRR